MFIRSTIHNFGSWVLVANDGASLTSHKIDASHPDVLMGSIVWQEGMNFDKDGNVFVLFLPKYW